MILLVPAVSDLRAVFEFPVISPILIFLTLGFLISLSAAISGSRTTSGARCDYLFVVFGGYLVRNFSLAFE